MQMQQLVRASYTDSLSVRVLVISQNSVAKTVLKGNECIARVDTINDGFGRGCYLPNWKLVFQVLTIRKHWKKEKTERRGQLVIAKNAVYLE